MCCILQKRPGLILLLINEAIKDRYINSAKQNCILVRSQNPYCFATYNKMYQNDTTRLQVWKATIGIQQRSIFKKCRDSKTVFICGICKIEIYGYFSFKYKTYSPFHMYLRIVIIVRHPFLWVPLMDN